MAQNLAFIGPGVWVADFGPAGGPDPPGNVRGYGLSTTSLQVTWNASPGATGYVVERSDSGNGGWVPQVLLGPGTTTWIDTDVDPLDVKFYRVFAINDLGIEYSNTKALPFQVLDRFDTDDAAPLTTPRTADGLGSFDITDVNSVLSVTGGRLRRAATTGTQPNARAVLTSGLSRVIGRCYVTKVFAYNTGGNTNFAAGHAISAGGVIRNGIQLANTNIQCTVRTNGLNLGTLVNGQDIQIMTIDRNPGCYYLVKQGSGNWQRLHASISDAQSPLYPMYQFVSSGTAVQVEIDNFDVHELPSPWDTQWGATEFYHASPAQGQAFTHLADTLVNFQVITLPSAGNFIRVRFRATGANDAWEIQINSAGDFTLNQITGGVRTQRQNTAGIIAALDYVEVQAIGTTFRSMEGNPDTAQTVRWTQTAATQGQTATDGSLFELSGGSAIANLATMKTDVESIIVSLS